ncbi:MAG: T9SS type A sorting domain-containing protein [Bacteroidota bacterium]
MTASAQNEFFTLLPTLEDSSSHGAVDVVYDPPTDRYWMLSTEYQFFNTSGGYPNSGWFVFGSRITALNGDGEVLWEQLYQTNCEANCSSFSDLTGRLPAWQLFRRADGNLVLTFEHSAGFQTCGTFASEVLYERTFIIAADDGTVLIDNDRLGVEDLSCRREELEMAHFQDEKLSVVLWHNRDSTSIRQYNAELELVAETIFNGTRKPIIYDPYHDRYWSIFDKTFYRWNEALTAIEDSLILELPAEFNGLPRFFPFENHILILYQGSFDVATNGQATKIWLLDKTTGVITEKLVLGKRYQRAIMMNGGLLLRASITNYSTFYTTPNPIVMDWLDLDLNLRLTRAYGEEAYGGGNLKRLSSTHYAILGSHSRSFDFDNGQAPDRAFIYVRSIDDLQAVTTEAVASPLLTVFPNPAQRTVTFAASDQAIKKLYWYDALGRLVWQVDTAPTQLLDIRHLPSGMYQVQIALADGSWQVEKVLIQP